MSERYWVVGGEYTDTRFAEIVGGGPERRLGPFDSYPEAKAVWRAKAMETIDDAHARWSIEKEDAREYWVVGGSYTGTRSEEHTSELQSLMRISYTVFCFKKKIKLQQR